MAWRKGRRKLKTLGDVRLYLSDLIARYDRQSLDFELEDDKPNNEVFSNLVRALSVMMQVIRQADLETRLEALESLLKDKHHAHT